MTVRLIDRPADLAEFAEEMAALLEGEQLVAKDLAVQYLDQNLAGGQDFEKAVAEFTSQCTYYA